jgi:hypothetical protein
MHNNNEPPIPGIIADDIGAAYSGPLILSEAMTG